MDDNKLENLVDRFERSVNVLERLLSPIEQNAISTVKTDATAALVGLGFKGKDVGPVVTKVLATNKDATVEDVIRESLRELQK